MKADDSMPLRIALAVLAILAALVVLSSSATAYRFPARDYTQQTETNLQLDEERSFRHFFAQIDWRRLLRLIEERREMYELETSSSYEPRAAHGGGNTAVPEPTAAVLFAAGLLVARAGIRRR